MTDSTGDWYQWRWEKIGKDPSTDGKWWPTRADALDAAADNARETLIASARARNDLVRRLRDAARDLRAQSAVNTDAAVAAYLAWRDVAEANDPISFSTAMVEASNAMSDLASWLPGFDVNTGTIAAERDEEQ